MKNKQKVLILKGLPASGKTTHAKDLMKNSREEWRRVNKDSLRDMAIANWTGHKEELIKKLHQDAIYTILVVEGSNLIIDDTNLNPKTLKALRGYLDDLISGHGLELDIEEKFFDVPVWECIARDAVRGDKSVGAKVIWRMYDQFLHKNPGATDVPYSDKKMAVICDIDGTLAHSKGRDIYDYKEAANDFCDPYVKQMLDILSKDYAVIIVSGREDNSEDVTRKWLYKNEIMFSELWMRAKGDHRPDTEVKAEIYEKYITPDYQVFCVFDDRLSVSRMWYDKGLKLFRVGHPDSDF